MRFAQEISELDQEFQRIKSDSHFFDSHAITSSAGARERAAAHRSACYVWLAAILERITKNSLQAAFREINARALPLKEIRLSLFSLICEPEISALSAKSRAKSWETRASIFGKAFVDSPAELAEEVLPLDGRTIRPEHFDVIWQVLGLSGESLPSPRHRFALTDLANGRNELAHGETGVVAFGRKKANSDLIRLVQHIDETTVHFLTSLDYYLDNFGFRR
jgi:hypothetical protein